ncbi:entericidin A/B family lipoprotein [Paracoccus limosus]|uniref:Entericidin A/B family lipoprotein n=1 Tax=Paracoccus limosus TaxID=913252 RepID=A0A844H7L0_9RHOB|nr:entericidin A/B family lipoprotein [Paracoccus limosus]
MVKLTPIMALLALAACQTVQGAGRDMQAAGHAVARESREVQANGL